MKTKSKKSQPQVLVVHLRRKTGSPRKVATLVAFKAHDDVVRIGYAKCRTRKDEFDNHVGYGFALGRAASLMYAPQMVADLTVPFTLMEDLKNFIGRASRFFKSDKVEVCGMPQTDVVDHLKAWKKKKPVAKAA